MREEKGAESKRKETLGMTSLQDDDGSDEGMEINEKREQKEKVRQMYS